MADKARYYERVLKSSKEYGFLPSSLELIKKYGHTEAVFRDTTAYVTAPSLTAYVAWILADAVSKGIKVLYFLSRDGLVLLGIAKTLCRVWNVDIECRYLYCSRLALRLPLYVVDKRFALEKLLTSEYNTSLKSILKRFNFTEKQCGEIAGELGINLTEALSKSALSGLKGKLERCDVFNKFADENSRDALANTTGYLKQEFSGVSAFAIVDTGWMGSIQSCLSWLLHKTMGLVKSSVTGYYMGMFRNGAPEYGAYNCFLFKNARGMLNYSGFSNNLLECLCAAGHGMTVGYRSEGGRWLPDMGKYEQSGCKSAWNARAQIEMCEAYTGYFAGNNNFNRLPNRKNLSLTAKRLLLGLMSKPSLSEAVLYGAIPFSDGMGAGGANTLAAKLSAEQIRYKSLTFRLFDALNRRKDMKPPAKPVYWLGGAGVLSGIGAFRGLDMRALDWLYWALYK